MGSAFTEREKEQIRGALKAAARRCAATTGMRKSTVDELAESAGISKGAFYRFYETKERLFFEILEDWHAEVCQTAWETWRRRTDLPDPERVAEALSEACRVMERNSMMSFFENDLTALLRKMPEEVLAQHYHSDTVHIVELVERAGVRLTVSPAVFSTVIKGLMLTLTHRRQIGEDYPQALSILIAGVCDRMIAP